MAGGDDLLLDRRHLRHVHLDAQVAAGHHHGVGLGDDRVEVGHRLRLLDLGHDPGPASPRRSSSRAEPGDVVGLADEREPDVLDRVLPAVQSRSCRSFSVSALTLSAAPGRFIPWCDRIRPGSVTFSRAQPGPRSTTSIATVPSANRTGLADLEVVGQLAVGAGQLVRIVRRPVGDEA